MAINYTHDFKLKAGNLTYQGEVEYPSGTYSEDQPEELPARLETDFKQMIDSLKKFHDTYGSLDEFEVKIKV